MIFLPDFNLYFVHIPKNGGISVHNALSRAATVSRAALATDLGVDEQAAAAWRIDHPALGPFHPAHIPLWAMKEHFPETFAALEGATSFALARDPRDRFLSALMQRMKEHLGAGAIRADDPIVLDEANAVCDWLSARRRHTEDEYCHFIRQVDFTDLDGVRIVDKVFAMNAMGMVQDWVQRDIGLTLEIQHEHARRQPKPWVRTIRPVARFVGRRLMPSPVRRAVYPLWAASGAYANAASGYGDVDLGNDVEAFIADYYSADAALYREALGNADQQDKV